MRTNSLWLVAALLAGAVSVAPAFAQNPPAPPKPPKPPKTLMVGHSSSYLGVGAIDIDDERARALNLKEARGVEIKSVEPDSPAAKAGIKEGDVVLEYNGEKVEGFEQFARLVRETPAGRQVSLVVWRNGATLNLAATIATRSGYMGEWPHVAVTIPPMPPMPPMDLPQTMTWRSSTLGIETEALTPQLADFFGVKQGVLVRSVNRNSAAEKAGIKAGDVIVKVDDSRVATPREITAALRALRGKRTFNVTVVRKQQETTLSVTLEERRGMGWRHTPPLGSETRYC